MPKVVNFYTKKLTNFFDKPLKEIKNLTIQYKGNLKIVKMPTWDEIQQVDKDTILNTVIDRINQICLYQDHVNIIQHLLQEIQLASNARSDWIDLTINKSWYNSDGTLSESGQFLDYILSSEIQLLENIVILCRHRGSKYFPNQSGTYFSMFNPYTKHADKLRTLLSNAEGTAPTYKQAKYLAKNASEAEINKLLQGRFGQTK